MCSIHKILETSIMSWINVKKNNRTIKFNQKAQLKPYIDMNTKLRTEAKTDFEKDFFKLMNSAVFAKTTEHVRKHRNIRLVMIEKRIYVVLKSSYYTTKRISKICL